jgi:hypothetical protein
LCFTAFDWSEAFFRVFVGFPEFFPEKNGTSVFFPEKIKMSIFFMKNIIFEYYKASLVDMN